MKLPKELRDKSKISLKNKKKHLYSIFKRTFNQLNNNYKTHYSVNYLKMGQTGKYSDLVTQQLGGYSNLDQKHFLLMAKEYENIEFYINWVRLGNIKLRGDMFYDLENNIEFFKNLYPQLAYHEYGHTYLITSTSTMFYPTEVLRFLDDNNIKSIRDVPEIKIPEINTINNNSKQNRINQKLKNVNFMDIAIGVAECHANYTMRNVLKLDSPIEFLNFSRVDLLDGLHDYSKFDMNNIDKDYINQRINNWLIKANDLFIYDKWDTMKKPCEKYGFVELFNFAYDLNCKYLSIINKNEEFNELSDEILSLAVETNKFNFSEMFF